jgi:hypothetical protein
MAFKVPKVERSPGAKKAAETEAKTRFSSKGTIASKTLTASKKRDQSITSRKKNSLGKLRGGKR